MSRVRSQAVSSVTKFVACLGLSSLVALSGCSSIQVGLKMRVSLAKTPVKSMEASLPKDPGVAPGEKSALVVTLAQPDGTVLVTEGKGKGKVLWKDLAITATVVSVSKKGIVSLPRDPRVSDGKMGHVAITIPSQPGITADLDIPLRYDYLFTATFSGSAGSKGQDGNNGVDGTSGFPGSIDLTNPVPGGNGSNGTSGTDGSNGGQGEDGPPVQIRVALRSGVHPLLQIGVTAQGHRERFYLVDPQGGSLTVRSSGGSGGQGGKGGTAGRGGSGGIGSPNGQDGSSGFPGQDGSAGRSGDGGAITVIYDPQAKPFLSTIQLPGSDGPQPVFTEQSVARLW
jgi:hypothetical protein